MKYSSALSQLLLACSCTSDVCDGETWGRYDWVADGVEGSSGCHPLRAVGETHESDGPATEIRIGGPGAAAEPAYMPLPFCLAGIELLNVDLRTGETGLVAPTPEIPDRETPAFWVKVVATNADHAACGTVLAPATTGGSWRVLRGGTWGQIIDVEAHDVTFAAVDGHQLVIPYGRWVARLPLEPIRYP